MIKPFLKVFVSIALLTLLIHEIDVPVMLSRLRQVNAWWVALASALLMFGQALSALRWSWLARALGLEVRIGRKVQLYFLGMFLSLFLPSIIGGDVARGFLLARGRQGAGWKAAASVILERINGVYAITALTTVALFFVSVPGHWLLLWMLAVAGLWAAMFGYRFWHSRLPAFAARWRDLPLDAPRFIMAWWKGLLLSLVFQTCVVLSTVALGHASGLEMAFPAYTVMVCLVALASALPISFNGFGIREAGYVGFSVYFGGDAEAAAAMAALWVIVLAVAAMPGAWVLWRLGGIGILKKPLSQSPDGV